MSAEQRFTPTPAPQATEHAKAHSYFVGRREFDAAEVYEVTVKGVRRLRSRRQQGEASLDWHGTKAARMELSHLLISRITKQVPSRDLQSRFSLYILNRLPAGGFVLDSDDISRWLRVAGDAQYSAAAPAPRRSWLRRLGW
jgi:hypothetical protein